MVLRRRRPSRPPLPSLHTLTLATVGVGVSRSPRCRGNLNFASAVLPNNSSKLTRPTGLRFRRAGMSFFTSPGTGESSLPPPPLRTEDNEGSSSGNLDWSIFFRRYMLLFTRKELADSHFEEDGADAPEVGLSFVFLISQGFGGPCIIW